MKDLLEGTKNDRTVLEKSAVLITFFNRSKSEPEAGSVARLLHEKKVRFANLTFVMIRGKRVRVRVKVMVWGYD